MALTSSASPATTTVAKYAVCHTIGGTPNE